MVRNVVLSVVTGLLGLAFVLYQLFREGDFMALVYYLLGATSAAIVTITVMQFYLKDREVVAEPKPASMPPERFASELLKKARDEQRP